MKLSEREIERFIEYLDRKYGDYCVNPDSQTEDCCDCYPCRVAFFDRVRKDLREMEI